MRNWPWGGALTEVTLNFEIPIRRDVINELFRWHTLLVSRPDAKIMPATPVVALIGASGSAHHLAARGVFTYDEVHETALLFDQEAVAVWRDVASYGTMIGPKAHSWLPFDITKFCILPRGAGAPLADVIFPPYSTLPTLSKGQNMETSKSHKPAHGGYPDFLAAGSMRQYARLAEIAKEYGAFVAMPPQAPSPSSAPISKAGLFGGKVAETRAKTQAEAELSWPTLCDNLREGSYPIGMNTTPAKDDCSEFTPTERAAVRRLLGLK